MKNNKGYTLVELLVSASIFAILSLGIAAFILSGMRMYNNINYSIRLQNQSQVTMSQIQEYVVDCNRGIAWEDVGGSGNGVLYVVNPDSTDAAKSIVHVFRYVSETAPAGSEQWTIYYGKTYGYENLDDNVNAIATDKLATDVSNFEVSFPSATTSGADRVSVLLELTKQTKSYSTTQLLALRNKPAYSLSWDDLWQKVK